MNAKHDQRLSMYRRWLAFLLKSSSYTNSLPGYSANYTAANTEVIKLQSISEQLQFSKAGLTKHKAELRKKLMYNLAESVNRGIAYCKSTSNFILLKEIQYTLSQIKRLTDNDLRDAAQGVYDKLQANLLALATYGISAITQATLQSNINAFTATIPNPSLGTNETFSLNEQLNASFKRMDAYMDLIDALVEMLRFSQPDFYLGYKKSKKIEKKGMRHLSMTCKIVDAISKKGIEGVTVVLILDPSSLQYDHTAEPITKITAKKGGFVIPNLLAGVYIIEAIKDGYQKTTASVIVEEGMLCKVKIEMIPIDDNQKPTT